MGFPSKVIASYFTIHTYRSQDIFANYLLYCGAFGLFFCWLPISEPALGSPPPQGEGRAGAKAPERGVPRRVVDPSQSQCLRETHCDSSPQRGEPRGPRIVDSSPCRGAKMAARAALW